MIVKTKYCDICGKEIVCSARLIKHTRKVFYTQQLEEDCCELCLYKISDFIDKLKKESKQECQKKN